MDANPNTWRAPFYRNGAQLTISSGRARTRRSWGVSGPDQLGLDAPSPIPRWRGWIQGGGWNGIRDSGN